ncbi:BTAD domain-containing putative transcriptional regulator [Nonomuraea sp. NPDC050783]|uniref:AfsR/SARP family transcriptional regulator n=1 Tax=Nonomuraea sp. NPDC050783 TaxID=3154634 RepID=UPI003465682C
MKTQFALLGPVSARGPEGPIALGSPKQRTVLAALLLNADRTVSDERLIALVWGEEPPRTAVARLYVYVHELREALGDKERIGRIGGGYRIRVGEDELDLHTFERYRNDARAHASAGRLTEAVAALRAAAGLWRGSALAGAGAVLIDQERPGLEDRRVGALEELYDLELESGRHGEIVGELHAVVGEYPLRERLVGQLMLALHRCECRAEALTVYRDARRRLVDELGIEPGQALRRLHQRLLQDDPERHSPPPPQPAGAVSPPVASPAELPRDVRGFAGREAELAWLDACLADGDGVCVLSGMAGIGKTALALHWAHQAKERFPDGQLYVNLRGHDPGHEPLTAAAALTRLLISLGVESSRVPDGFEARLGLYRSLTARRSFLLFLDNARSAAQVEQLLPPAGAALVTSRRRLGELVASVGAGQRSLGPLPDQDGRALLDGVLGPVRAAPEARARDHLVRLCGGLPLALRIAAANAASRPGNGAAAVAAELAAGDRLAGLSVDGAGHSAITAAFSASYRALVPAERRVFRLLGLVPGPEITVAGAAALADVPADVARTCLSGLTAAHLLEQHATGRYRFHDLIRLYAAAEGERDPEREPAWQRLLGHYLDVAAAIAAWCAPDRFRPAGSRPPAGAVGQPPHAAADTANVMAATVRAMRAPGPAAWRLADMVRVICARTGRLGEWLEIAPAMLEAARAREVPAARVMLHTSLGEGLFRAGRSQEAVQHLEQAVLIARDSGGREGEAAARVGLSFAHTWTGHLDEALAGNLRAAQLFGALGSVSGQNHALNTLAGQYHHLGRLDLAERRCRQALALSRAHGLSPAEGADLRHLGAVLLDQGRYEEAESCLRESARLLAALGGHGAAASHTWISRLHWERGEWARSREEALRALEVARDQEDRLVEAAAWIALADAAIPLGLTAEAARSLERADELVSAGGLRWHLAYALVTRARLHDARGEHDRAIRHALQARDVARDNAYRLPELAALTELAGLERRRGDHEAGARTAAHALRLCEQIGHAPCAGKLAPSLATGSGR